MILLSEFYTKIILFKLIYIVDMNFISFSVNWYLISNWFKDVMHAILQILAINIIYLSCMGPTTSFFFFNNQIY